MSGQPLRHPNDASKFRKAYMATLQLQSEIIKKNFDANALYHRTGVVPTQITDYRSTSEKLADIINLRILIRAQLRQIADAQNAEDIAQSLSADQLVFLSQHIDAIIKDLKPKNKFGVLKDIFMQYLDKYISKEQGNQLASVGLPTVRPDRTAPVDGPVDEVDTSDRKEVIRRLRSFLQRNGTYLAELAVDGLRDMEFLSGDDLREDLSRLQNPVQSAEINSLLELISMSLPSTEQLTEIVDKLEQFGNDEEDANDMLEDLIEKVTFNGSLADLRERAAQLLQQYLTAQQGGGGGGGAPLLRQPEAFDEEARTDIQTTSSRTLTGREDWLLKEPLPPIQIEGLDYEQSLQEYLTYGGKGRRSAEEEHKSKEALVKLLRPYARARVIPVAVKDTQNADDLKKTLQTYYSTMKRAYLTQRASIEEAEKIGKSAAEPPSRSYDEGASAKPKIFIKTGKKGPPPPPATPPKMAAEGLHRRVKGRGIAVDYSKGIDPLPKFAPVGNYYINLQKLRDDVVAICRPDGKNLNTWKARRLSLPLANLIRKLVNKGKPTFDEISALTDEERYILGDFIRKAKLEMDIPNSKIDREDLTQFEIMKGEIMAGNDSTELIKKFKLLIVKLSNEGRLPKGQAKEILMELATLGY